MTVWILSIVGCAFLGVMIDIVSPNGSLNKFIKSIFALFLVFVLMGPIKNFITTKTSGLGEISVGIKEDEEFLIKYNQNLAIQYEQEINKRLVASGIEGVSISILINLSNVEFEIIEVAVWLENLVLNENINHNNKYEKIEKVIKEVVGDEQEIEFYE